MKLKPRDSQEEQAFDSYVKKTLKGSARDYYRKIKKRRDREVYYSELSQAELMNIAVTDRYFVAENSFDVLDWKIDVNDADLAAALKELPTERRDIVLLSYFLDMTDKEIAECMKLANSTVAYRRTASLKKLKNIMEENADE